MRFLKAILFLIALCLLCSIGYGQSTPNWGSANALQNNLGGAALAKWLKIPSDTLDITSTLISKNYQLAAKAGILYLRDTAQGKWVAVGTATDSGTFVTNTILHDSLDGIDLQRVLDNGNRASGDTLILDYGNVRAYKGFFGDTGTVSTINPSVPNRAKLAAATDSTNFLSALRGIYSYTFGSRTIAPSSSALYSVDALAGVRSTNTQDWTIGIHPNLVGYNAIIYAETGATGTSGYSSCFSGTVAAQNGISNTHTFDIAAGFTMDYGSAKYNHTLGIHLFQCDRGASSNAYILGTAGISHMPPTGKTFFVYDTTGYQWAIVNGGVLSIGNSFNYGNGSLFQLTGRGYIQGLLKYAGDSSANYDARTLIDKGYADATYGTIASLADYMLRSDSATTGANKYITPYGLSTFRYRPLGLISGQDTLGSADNVTRFFSSGIFRGSISLSGQWALGTNGVDPTNGFVVRVAANTTNSIRWENTASGTTGTDGFRITQNSSLATDIVNMENAPINFGTQNTLVGAWSAAGKFLSGSTTDDLTGREVQVTGQLGATDTIRTETVMQEAGITSSILSTNSTGVHQAASISTGLALTANALTNNLVTGIAGTGVLNGSTDANGDLSINPTTNGTTTTSTVAISPSGGDMSFGSTSSHLSGVATAKTFTLTNTAERSIIEYWRNSNTITDNGAIGQFDFYAGTTPAQIAAIVGLQSGTAENAGKLVFYTANGSGGVAHLLLNQAGNLGLGLGVTDPSAKFHVVSTTEQQRTAYDASNYLSTTISSAGNATLNLTASSGTPRFTFSDDVISTKYYVSTLNTPPATAASTGTQGEIRFGSDGYLYLCTATNTWVRVQLSTW